MKGEKSAIKVVRCKIGKITCFVDDARIFAHTKECTVEKSTKECTVDERMHARKSEALTILCHLILFVHFGIVIIITFFRIFLFLSEFSFFLSEYFSVFLKYSYLFSFFSKVSLLFSVVAQRRRKKKLRTLRKLSRIFQQSAMPLTTKKKLGVFKISSF